MLLRHFGILARGGLGVQELRRQGKERHELTVLAGKHQVTGFGLAYQADGSAVKVPARYRGREHPESKPVTKFPTNLSKIIGSNSVMVAFAAADVMASD